MGKIKINTIKRYSTEQLWRAVMRRDKSYSHDGYGAIYHDGLFYASYSWNRQLAIQALVDCGAAPLRALYM